VIQEAPNAPPSASKAALPGLLLCLILAGFSIFLADLPLFRDTLHLGALLLVILLGMLWKSLLPLPDGTDPGIRLAQRPILRLAVAGLGFRLSFQEVARIGGPAMLVILVSTIAALGFGLWIARLFRLDEKLGILLAVGTSICGASAIVAADSVVQGQRRDVAVSLASITFLGTLGIVLYPLLARLLGLPEFLYGVWAGASLHEMAQVVAAGYGVSEPAGDAATIVKLARITLLAPIVFFISWQLRRVHQTAGEAKVPLVPWFLVLFLVFAGVNSIGILAPSAVAVLQRIDLWLLAVGMAGVGLQTGFSDLRAAGPRTLAIGLAQWVFLAVLSLALCYVLLIPR
jgi:uncharacterized integral membrane protein (TIGR00698 family)